LPNDSWSVPRRNRPRLSAGEAVDERRGIFHILFRQNSGRQRFHGLGSATPLAN
jgi:hypothetical protein